MGGLFSSPKPSRVDAPEKIGQITSTGTSLFGTIDPSTGEFVSDPSQTVQKTTESDFAQQFRQGTEGLKLGVLGQLGQPLQQVRGSEGVRQFVPEANKIGKNLPTLGAGLTDTRAGLQDLQAPGQDLQRLEQATFEGVKRRVEPEFQLQRERLAQQLADQGIPVGSKAFERELTRQETAQGEVLTRAGFDAVQAGRTEAERQSRLGLSQRGQLFGEATTQRGQLFGEQSQTRSQLEQERRNVLQDSIQRQGFLFNLEQQKRGQQFGELGALGGFISPFQASPIGALAGAQVGAKAAGGGFDILGKAAGGFAASDINLKENIKYIGEENGHSIYEFNYKDKSYGEGRFKGVMAHEVEKITPAAVITMADGFKAVFYSMIGIRMEAV